MQSYLLSQSHEAKRLGHLMIQSLMKFLTQLISIVNAVFSNQNLMRTQEVVRQTFPNLLIERLYYADGRQNPSHPLHGSYLGLSRG